MRPHGNHAIVNSQNPEAFAQCDRCGAWWNRSQLLWQMQWSGTHLYNLGILVCPRCIDVPQEQLRTIILPPDPPPVINARPPNFTFEETGPVQTTLTATLLVDAPVLALPVQSVDGFNVGDAVWVQLVNATNSGSGMGFTQALIASIDAVDSILVLDRPLPATAPINGTVTVSDTFLAPLPPPPPNAYNGTGSLSALGLVANAAFVAFAGAGSLNVNTSMALRDTANFAGAGSLSTSVGLARTIVANFAGTGSLSATPFTFNPASLIIGNGGFWRADIGVTGTTSVTAWADQSIFGNNLSVVNIIQQSPSWSTTGFNGAFPAVTMPSGGNGGLGIASFNFSSNTVTAFFLIFQNVLGSSFARYIALNNNGDGDFNSPDAFEMDEGNPNSLNCTHNNAQVGNGASVGPALTASTAFLFGIEFDGTNGTRWSAGSVVGSPTSITDTLGGTLAGWFVGKTGSGDASGASFAFVGLTQKAMNSTDWTNLKNFANANWGTSF